MKLIVGVTIIVVTIGVVTIVTIVDTFVVIIVVTIVVTIVIVTIDVPIVVITHLHALLSRPSPFRSLVMKLDNPILFWLVRCLVAEKYLKEC